MHELSLAKRLRIVMPRVVEAVSTRLKRAVIFHLMYVHGNLRQAPESPYRGYSS